MKKRVLFAGLLFLFSFFFWNLSRHIAEGETENRQESIYVQGESNDRCDELPVTTEMLQPDEEYVEVGELLDIDHVSGEISFLMAEEISLEGQVVKANAKNSSILLELLRHLPVKETSHRVWNADFYILLCDDRETMLGFIEVWDRYIRIDQVQVFEVMDDEFCQVIEKIVSESDPMEKVPVDEILISCAKDFLFGEYTPDDITLYNEKPAILVKSGFEEKDLEEQIYYQTFLYYDGLYFDRDYQTTYMFSVCRVLFRDGNIYDMYSKRMAYYDYFTGERKEFLY